MNLRNYQRKNIRVAESDLVEVGHLKGNEPPLVVRPKSVAVELSDWTAEKRGWIEENLTAHGAVLFRGFRVDSVDKFKAFSRSLAPQRDGYNERTSPRKELGDDVFTSTEYPADQHILFHNANSYSHFWPMKIWFGCIIKSEEGGSTPISDCRRILDCMDPALLGRFEELGVLYQRNFMPGMGLSWQETFQTTDKAEVDAYCKEAGITWTWVSDSHLRTRQRRQGVAIHPITGQRSWFNQALLFHISMLERSLAASFVAGFPEEDLPSNSYFGDGSPILPEHLAAIQQAYQEASYTFDWETGDVMLLDNMQFAHARTPFVGKRLITVGFSGRHFSGYR